MQQKYKGIKKLAFHFADRLFRYPLPGNVRELENIISSAALLEEGKVLTRASAPALLTFSRPPERHDVKKPTLAVLKSNTYSK